MGCIPKIFNAININSETRPMHTRETRVLITVLHAHGIPYKYDHHYTAYTDTLKTAAACIYTVVFISSWKKAFNIEFDFLLLKIKFHMFDLITTKALHMQPRTEARQIERRRAKEMETLVFGLFVFQSYYIARNMCVIT